MKSIVYDYSKLKKRIIEYFGTYEDFAKSIELSEKSLIDILNNVVKFTQDEIYFSIIRLNINLDEIFSYFFKEKV